MLFWSSVIIFLVEKKVSAPITGTCLIMGTCEDIYFYGEKGKIIGHNYVLVILYVPLFSQSTQEICHVNLFKR